MDLEPLTTIPGTPSGSLTRTKPAANGDKAQMMDNAEISVRTEPGARSEPVAKVEPLPAGLKPAVAKVEPVQRTSLAAVEPSTQKRRDNDRRKILEDELSQEEQSLTSAQASLRTEQQNPQLVAAVRAAQQADNPTPAQMVEFRNNIDKASGRIRGLQATVAEHEKNIEALKKELGALKP
jgi:predicted  nucleic acid-binding Zn-ribbon protein